MAGRAINTFTANGNFVAPNGVTRVRVITNQLYPGVQSIGATALSFFVSADGYGYSCGLNTNGNLGLGGVGTISTFTQILGNYEWRQLITAQNNTAMFSAGLSNGGTAYMWGFNSNGQLGTGDVTARSSPVAVLGGLVFASLMVPPFGNACAFGLSPGGTAYAWGGNSNGLLGVGDTTSRSSPVAVLGGLTFASLTSDQNNTVSGAIYGLTAAGVAYAWGGNTNGGLGVGDVTPRSSPVAVLGGLTFASILSQNGCAIGLTSSGTAYGWGLNASGCLGVGDVTPRSSPVAVLGGLTFKQIVSCPSTGPSTSFIGITTGGVAYGWGANPNGELGVGDVAARSSPVAVLGGLTFASIASDGNASFYGVTAAGVAYAWGVNGQGQLGVGNTSARSSPVAVLGGITFSKILSSVPGANSATGNVYGITSDGQMYAWGANANGQLGIGTTTSVSSPVAVLGGRRLAQFFPEMVTDLTVVPGTTYAVVVNTGLYATFGGVPVGQMCSSVTVEFWQ